MLTLPLNPYTVLNGTYAFYVLTLLIGIFLYKKYLPSEHTSISYQGKVSTKDIHYMDLLGLGFFVILFFAFIFSNQIAVEKDITEIKLTPFGLITMMIAQVIPAVIVVGFLFFRKISLLKFFGLSHCKPRYIFVIAPLFVVYTYIFISGLGYLGYTEFLQHLFGEEIKAQDAIRIYQAAEDPFIRALFAVSVVIIAPVVEEIVFRGYIYTVTKRYTARVFSTIISALIFALVHNYIPGLIPLTFLAILLTVSYERTGSLWVPISIHALFNASMLLIQEINIHH